MFSELEGDLTKCRDDETLEKDDGQYHHDRREIKPPEGQGKDTSHPVEQWIGDVRKEPDNGIVRVRIHPREQGPDDQDPHIHGEDDVNNRCDRIYEISEDEH